MAGAPSGRDVGDDPEVVEQGAFVDINITPLVDIFLVLLVILMASSTALLEAGQGEGAGFRVQLPSGQKSDEVKPGGHELVVAIASDGVVIFRGEERGLAELEELFKEEAAKDPERLVLVQADENTFHKRVVEVMEMARRAGLRNLAIATKPEN